MTSQVGPITETSTIMLRWSRQSVGSSDSSDNEEGQGSFSKPYAFEPTSASVNYHEDADSETTGSDDVFHGVEFEVAERTSGTYLTENGEN